MFEVVQYIYALSPEISHNIGIGLFSSVTRMAFDDRLCSAGIPAFLSNLTKQFLISIFMVVVGVAVAHKYGFAGTSIGTAITLMCGFFARDLLQECLGLAQNSKKIIERIIGNGR